MADAVRCLAPQELIQPCRDIVPGTLCERAVAFVHHDDVARRVRHERENLNGVLLYVQTALLRELREELDVGNHFRRDVLRLTRVA
jgi:hypothetical protein